ncbi:Soluble epoxide hydrolase [Bradyrhizobium ivorense]|uniref:Soluble epoxide hydrolase n=1 Tax=Bradyrhizobium ivorense TaxID=2511166 RepID=A0A508T299_9BRAD|nr:alpha/beta hydrolase [Bradyrhizobium ivorense]VIO68301.1 Soluble epoxide hydrolase [Bradyrhizobium ivorense]
MTTNPSMRTRRSVLITATAATAIGLLGDQLRLAAARAVKSESVGSVRSSPYLPEGFTDRFGSRYINANGVRLHAVIGGNGPPLLLVHGWPQTWYQWRLVMPALARDFTVIAVDQRGIGLSDKPEGGYDSGTQANDLVALMDALGHRRFAIVGFDTGMGIAYALAADHPDRVERLVVGEAIITGVTHSPPLLVPGPLNKRLWHIAFNRLDASVNEALVRGREDIYFGAEYAQSAGTALPAGVIKHYVDGLASSPDALRGSFGSYRAIDATTAQNAERRTRRLTLPVLAIGGEKGLNESTVSTMKLVADNVQGVVIQGSGHWVAEEAPEKLLAALIPFLTPYRDAAH